MRFSLKQRTASKTATLLIKNTCQAICSAADAVSGCPANSWHCFQITIKTSAVFFFLIPKARMYSFRFNKKQNTLLLKTAGCFSSSL